MIHWPQNAGASEVLNSLFPKAVNVYDGPLHYQRQSILVVGTEPLGFDGVRVGHFNGLSARSKDVSHFIVSHRFTDNPDADRFNCEWGRRWIIQISGDSEIGRTFFPRAIALSPPSVYLDPLLTKSFLEGHLPFHDASLPINGINTVLGRFSSNSCRLSSMGCLSRLIQKKDEGGNCDDYEPPFRGCVPVLRLRI